VSFLFIHGWKIEKNLEIRRQRLELFINKLTEGIESKEP
jgi:hypothetical protein